MGTQEERDRVAALLKEGDLMSYGCRYAFHIEEYMASFRKTSPVLRSEIPPDNHDSATLTTLTEEEQRLLLNLGALGLAGEAGEAVDMVKKQLFHGVALDRTKLLLELGDVLWYIACLAESQGSDIAEIARMNQAKLAKRYPAGFVTGGGLREA